MPSGGARARSGPAPDPKSYRSLDREWIELPIDGFDGGAPDFPLPLAVVWNVYYDEDKNRIKEVDTGATESLRETEADLWEKLWAKPQAAAWVQLGLEFQVAAYVRAFVESTSADAPASLKTAVLRMETELGISVSGMRANLWKIADPTVTAPPAAPRRGRGKAAAASQGNVSWMNGMKVEGA